MMNPSVNHDVKGVMAGISNGEVSLELARRKIAWLDLLPFPMHVDADAKDCLNFIRKQDMGLYVRLISAMARLHHAFFDALGGLDNVCVIAQSSIVGRSKSNNVFRHFFAEVEEHCDSNLSFGPIEKFGFKAHPCSFLTGRYPGLEGLERTDAEIAYAYALVFGEYVKINMGASAVAKDGEGYAATQANRSVQGKKRGKKCKDEGLAIFELVPDPDNPGEKITVATLHGRKLVPDPKNPGEKITVFALRARKNLSLSADRRLDRNKATSKTLAAKRDEMNRVKIVVGTVCPRCKTALKRDCLATVSILNKARKDETVTPSLRVSFYCPCKVQGNRCGKRNIVDAHDRAELYKNSEHLSDAQKSQMEISIAAWMVRAVDRFNAAGRAAADDAGEVFRPCVITDRMIKDMGPQMPGTSISTQRRRKLKKMAEESGGG